MKHPRPASARVAATALIALAIALASCGSTSRSTGPTPALEPAPAPIRSPATDAAPPPPPPDAAAPPPHAAAAPDIRVVWQGESPYGNVFVTEGHGLRAMRIGGATAVEQTVVRIDDPYSYPSDYVDWMLVALPYAPRLERLLMIGLGGGAISNVLHRAMPEVRIEAVEINAAVVEAARRYFNVHEDARYRVITADGAAYVAASTARYDVIMLDAYAGEDIPDALATSSFFAQVRARLATGGVAAINIATEGAAARRVAQAFRAVFPDARCYETPADGNLIVVGAVATPTDAALSARATALDARLQRRVRLGEIALHPATPAMRRCALAGLGPGATPP